MFRAVGSHHLTDLTQQPGTPIVGLIPPHVSTPSAYARVTSLWYRCPGVAHTITILKACWRTTLSAPVDEDDLTLTLTADLGDNTAAGSLALGDWLCVQLGDGSYWLAESSNKSSLTLTLTEGCPADAAAGNVVWVFGVPSDHEGDPRNGRPRNRTGNRFTADVLGLNTWGDAAVGLCSTLRDGDPLMVHIDNVEQAGRLEQCCAAYTLN